MTNRNGSYTIFAGAMDIVNRWERAAKRYSEIGLTGLVAIAQENVKRFSDVALSATGIAGKHADEFRQRYEAE